MPVFLIGRFHVTSDFLKNPWNSYSYEFVMFLNEFCVTLSEDPNFHFNLGREKFLSPIIQVLGRPFSITQIYKLWPYFVEKFTKGALVPQVVSVTNGTAVMRMQFSDRTSQPIWCVLSGVCRTDMSHGQSGHRRSAGSHVRSILRPPFKIAPAWVMERTIVNGHSPGSHRKLDRSFGPWPGCWPWEWPSLPFSRPGSPELSFLQAIGVTAVPSLSSGSRYPYGRDRKELQQREKIIQEQFEAAETRHEELREAYLTQEQITTS